MRIMNRHIRHIFLLALVIVMMVACGGGGSDAPTTVSPPTTTPTPTPDPDPMPQPTPEPQQVPIGFKADLSDAVATTRSAGDGVLDNDVLQAKGFGVFCWYTGATTFDPAFTSPKTHIKDYAEYELMRNQKVEYIRTSVDQGYWTYSPSKYWPLNPEEKLTFRAYAPYTDYIVTDNKGIAIGDKFQRYAFNINLDQDLGKWVKYGTSTRYGYFDRSGSHVNFSDAYLMNPLGVPYNEDGSIRLLTWEDNNYANNPLSALNEITNNVGQNFTTNNYLDVTFPIKGLTYRLNTGYTFNTRLYQNYKGLDTVDGNKNGGVLQINNNYRKDWLIENILSYTRDFGKHTIFLTGLYSSQYSNRVSNTINASGFPNDVMTYWQPNKANALSASANSTTTTHISQMLRANYSYDSRYLITLTARRDGFSAFGADRKYGIFPSVALGWNIAREPFMKDTGLGKTFNNLKFRLSWGKNGNEAIDAYATLPVLRGKNYLTDDYNPVYGFYPNQLASPILGWETTTSYNAGLDFGILKDRIKGTFDIYTTRTTDLLLERTIPSINGTNSLLQNIGKTKGHGIEFQISSVNVATKNFTWSTNFNIVHYHNEIVDVGLYDEAGKPIDDVASEWFIGYPQRPDHRHAGPLDHRQPDSAGHAGYEQHVLLQELHLLVLPERPVRRHLPQLPARRPHPFLSPEPARKGILDGEQSDQHLSEKRG